MPVNNNGRESVAGRSAYRETRVRIGGMSLASLCQRSLMSVDMPTDYEDFKVSVLSDCRTEASRLRSLVGSQQPLSLAGR